ncbi:MAG: hypothetical protein R2733_09575 [Acidimicrobiales bacterium]
MFDNTSTWQQQLRQHLPMVAMALGAIGVFAGLHLAISAVAVLGALHLVIGLGAAWWWGRRAAATGGRR